MGDVFIDGVGHTEFGKDFRNLEIILADAGQEALNNSRIEMPNKVILGNFGCEGYEGVTIDEVVRNFRKVMGLSEGIGIEVVRNGSSTGAAAIKKGYEYASEGYNVLVVSGEKMKSKKSRREEVTRQNSEVIHQMERRMGLTMPMIAALATIEYMELYRIKPRDLKETFFSILNRNRKWGSENPFAYKSLKRKVQREKFFDEGSNPIIAWPLTMFDCAGTYNGAAAAVLVPYETDLKISGIMDSKPSRRIKGRETLTSLDATFNAATKLFPEIGLNPYEIDIVELHDAFTPVPIIGAEDIGLMERGRGAEFILAGKNSRGKKVVYNASGGFQCKTHPIAASGTAQFVELVNQFRRQGQYERLLSDYENLNYGLTFSMNGFGFHNYIIAVERTYPTVKREGFDEQYLPQEFVPSKKGLTAEIFSGLGFRRLIGTVKGKEEVSIGVVRSDDGRLHLALYHGELPPRGGYVDVCKGEKGLHFMPLSNAVFNRLVGSMLGQPVQYIRGFFN